VRASAAYCCWEHRSIESDEPDTGIEIKESRAPAGKRPPNPLVEDGEVIREFLIESNENLNRLDAEIVDLERNPTQERLASIFRTIHTINGTFGFFGFDVLEGIIHRVETILGQLRTGRRQVSGVVVSLILATIDAVRRILGNVESSGTESDDEYSALTGRLEAAAFESGEVASAIQGPVAARLDRLPINVLEPPAVASVVADQPRPNGPVVARPTVVPAEPDKGSTHAPRSKIPAITVFSCDHGIEDQERRRARGNPPRELFASRPITKEDKSTIEISDDGAGLDVERVRSKVVDCGLIRAHQATQLSERETMNLLFLHGLSTAGQVTTVSGRGVGLDVVTKLLIIPTEVSSWEAARFRFPWAQASAA